jgi:hypothetical protein
MDASTNRLIWFVKLRSVATRHFNTLPFDHFAFNLRLFRAKIQWREIKHVRP